MGKNSNIEWTDNTFNPWFGCKRVSTACVRCYIERSPALRFRKMKLGDMPVRTSPAYWKQPLQWQKEFLAKAQDASEGSVFDPPLRRPRVFCLSLGDWLDDRVPIEWLADLVKLIHDTPNLDWQLLTKRPQNWRSRLEACLPIFEQKWRFEGYPGLKAWLQAGWYPENVWIGITGENQEQYDKRVPDALLIPARVHFVSAEPLLSNLDLRLDSVLRPDMPGNDSPSIDWVICGGETGQGARRMEPDWARSLRDQCHTASVPFFFKQWGDWGLTKGTNIEPHIYVAGEGMAPMGKKAAGRKLDGVEWNEMPKLEVSA